MINRQGAKTPREEAGQDEIENRQVEPVAELDALTHRVIGCAIAVHRVLGPGHLEAAYESALCIEFGEQRISFERQFPVTLKYHDQSIGEYRLDLLVDGKLIVEIKTVEQLAPIHHAQLLAYLKATSKQLGLLINFNTTILKHGIKRVVLS